MKFKLYYPYYYERTNTIEFEAKEIKKELQGKEKYWYNILVILMWLTTIAFVCSFISLFFVAQISWLPFAIMGFAIITGCTSACINHCICCINYYDLQEKYCKDELEAIKQIRAKCEEQKQQVEDKKKEWCRKVLEEQDAESLYNIIKMLE